MADDTLEFFIDKFTFRIATDRWYTEEGLWAKPEGSRVRIGLSDYLQQRSGDVAFVTIEREGMKVNAGDELVVIETIKVNISLTAPLGGRVVEVNPATINTPEIINQDPYGEGWLVLVEAEDGKPDLSDLLDPQAYFDRAKLEAERESGKQ